MAYDFARPRVLLRQLRILIKQYGSDQEQLDRIVRLIANNMVSEVCSLYVEVQKNVYELFSSEGLDVEAVHKTSLHAGEGLVGMVAKSGDPVVLSDAQSHPKFVHLPQTKEERFHSFLGVPILRGGSVIGVLVVQNEAYREYSDEEVEVLEIIAMVIGEIISSEEFVSKFHVANSAVNSNKMVHKEALGMAEGIAIGKAVLHEPKIHAKEIFADDPVKERQRLNDALLEIRESIDTLLDNPEVESGSEYKEIIEAYKLFAYDEGWVKRMMEVVDAGLSAEAAVERVQNIMRMRLNKAGDLHIREKMHDLEDLTYRLMRQICGVSSPSSVELSKNSILIARRMGPAELLEYDSSVLSGLILEDASTTSHVTIVARALDIPLVGGVYDIIDEIEEGDEIILDASKGDIYIRPNNEVKNSYHTKLKLIREKKRKYSEQANIKAISKDGIEVKVMINAGLLVDLPHIDEFGADGIGLFRTEFQFLVASKFPRKEEQAALYEEVLSVASDREVTFRTVDIGGDKVLPYMRAFREENPAMGWRAIRMALDRPGLFITQIRALIIGSKGRNLRIMLPFITEIEEIDKAKIIIDKQLKIMNNFGYELPSSIQLGAIIEVPSLIFQLDELLQKVDFISVGSNDLKQFLYAMDRGNVKLSGRYDDLSAPFLRALSLIVQKCDEYNRPVNLCGEMAGDKISAIALMAIGFRSLSMSASRVGRIKSIVRKINISEIRKIILKEIEANNPNIRNLLLDYLIQKK